MPVLSCYLFRFPYAEETGPHPGFSKMGISARASQVDALVRLPFFTKYAGRQWTPAVESYDMLLYAIIFGCALSRVFSCTAILLYGKRDSTKNRKSFSISFSF